MFGKFMKPIVPTVPKSEHETLRKRHDAFREEVTRLERENAAMHEELLAAHSANEGLRAELARLKDESEATRPLLQEAINLLLKVDSKRSGGKEWSDKRAGIISRASELGVNVFEVVAEKSKETP